MGIQQICTTISNFFKNIRPPFPHLNGLMLVSSMLKRPGLSTIQSTANVVKDLNKLGIPTGQMPDGSDNLTVAVVYCVLKEVFRALKFDAKIQVNVQPGTLMLTAFGANAGGPIVVNGYNTNDGGIMRGKLD